MPLSKVKVGGGRPGTSPCAETNGGSMRAWSPVKRAIGRKIFVCHLGNSRSPRKIVLPPASPPEAPKQQARFLTRSVHRTGRIDQWANGQSSNRSTSDEEIRACNFA